MKPRMHWTDEDAAFCVMQWASGIKQSEIAKIYGYANPSPICTHIEEFLRRYGGGPSQRRQGGPGYVLAVWGDSRKQLAEVALARFVATRPYRIVA